MSKALGINPDISLEQILRLSQSNDWDVVYNPFMNSPGEGIGGTFIKPAPTHEGIKAGGNVFTHSGGSATTVDDEYIERLNDATDGDQVAGVGEALQNAHDVIAEVQNDEGTPTGVAVVEVDGQITMMPEYSAVLAEHDASMGDARIIQGGYKSYHDAMSRFLSAGGQMAERPTVF